jgi:ribosomal protein S2
MCGEFACTKKWVRGFLSNFKSIQKSVKNFAIKKFAHKKSFFKMHLIDN